MKGRHREQLEEAAKNLSARKENITRSEQNGLAVIMRD
jgi:hypothetical protein